MPRLIACVVMSVALVFPGLPVHAAGFLKPTSPGPAPAQPKPSSDQILYRFIPQYCQTVQTDIGRTLEPTYNRIRDSAKRDPSGSINTNFDPTWDWTRQQKYTLFINNRHIQGGTQQKNNIDLPWYSYNSPTFGVFGITQEARDIYPKDGWLLLYRDFGTLENPVQIPNIILYNCYTGVLRLFFYYTGEERSHGIVELSLPDSNNFPAIFMYLDPEGRSALSPTNVREISKNRFKPISYVTRLVQNQWSYAEFLLVGYDPNLPQDSTIEFRIIGIDQLVGDISGTLFLEQLIPDAEISNTNYSINIQAVSSKAVNVYKNISSATSGIRRWSTEYAGDWRGVFASKIVDSGLLAAIPYVGAAVTALDGIIGFLTNDDQHDPPIPLRFQGDIHLTATLSSPFDYGSIYLRVPGASHTERSGVTIRNLPFHPDPLGVYNLVELTTMRYAIDNRIFSCLIDHSYSETYRNDTHTWRIYHQANPISLVFNPKIANMVSEVAFAYALPGHPVDFFQDNVTTGYFNAVNFTYNVVVDQSWPSDLSDDGCDFALVYNDIGHMSHRIDLHPDGNGPWHRNIGLKIVIKKDQIGPIYFLKNYVPYQRVDDNLKHYSNWWPGRFRIKYGTTLNEMKWPR